MTLDQQPKPHPPVRPLSGHGRGLGAWHPRAFTALAVCSAALAASFTLLAVRPPNAALGYSQSYNCESFVGQPTCHLTAGSWHNITNVGAANYSVAGDICAQYGQLSATYTCASSGYSILLCGSSVYEYGISETYLGDNDNIAGHEDDSSTCS